MGSLTGKFSKGILDDFIFKAAVWCTSCFKSSVPGIRKQAMETQRHQRTFVKVASLEKSGSFLSLRIPLKGWPISYQSNQGV
ncbi:hypothetical protein AY601_2721 [Pedobacter cryoconitis]|uniref:Uncharacterized protein n=2 Tax=Pedobacter cryoconitis TaxID=188932 RepID=A0A127VE04_9SPHI|nr:hypothetical protein AY601_2721 [Pedobacter cryoconitis]